jgi:hypothetical protein
MNNIENIRRLAARLRAPSTQGHFDMKVFFNSMSGNISTIPMGEDIHNCGTIACIAGFATALAMPDASEEDVRTGYEGYDRIGQRFLGLTDDQRQQLFLPSNSEVQCHLVTAEVAAGVLDNLALTGEITWPVAVRK